MGGQGAQGAVRELIALVRAQVEHQAMLGALGWPRQDPSPAPAGRSRPAGTIGPGTGPRPPGAATAGGGGDVAAAVPAASTLETLRRAIGDCRRCPLAAGRTHLVFGVGNPRARLVFVGEGQGEEEDRRGEPFVGRAGQLLTDIITKGMGLRREDVYICNVVKCRPPGNRNPAPDEVESCEPFLRRQLELIAPDVVVALGKFAAQTLLREKTPITRLRGRWFDYHGTKLMPTFHPAYLLRNPADKRLVWADVREVMAVLGLPVSRR